MFAPPRDGVAAIVSGVEALGDSALTRSNLAGALQELLPTEPGKERLAIQPDLVGDHLALREFADKPAGSALFVRTLSAVVATVDGEDEKQHRNRFRTEIQVAYDNLARSAQNDAALAEWLARRALQQRPETWPAAFQTSFRQGGPFVPGLEALAADDCSAMPAEELSAIIPPNHGALLMAVISLDDVWVDANFKEGQLKQMRVEHSHDPWAGEPFLSAARL